MDEEKKIIPMVFIFLNRDFTNLGIHYRVKHNKNRSK